MSSIVLTSLIALAAFGAGWFAGRLRRPARPSVDAVMAAGNAELRRRMDELADALLATDKRKGEPP